MMPTQDHMDQLQVTEVEVIPTRKMIRQLLAYKPHINRLNERYYDCAQSIDKTAKQQE